MNKDRGAETGWRQTCCESGHSVLPGRVKSRWRALCATASLGQIHSRCSGPRVLVHLRGQLHRHLPSCEADLENTACPGVLRAARSSTQTWASGPSSRFPAETAQVWGEVGPAEPQPLCLASAPYPQPPPLAASQAQHMPPRLSKHCWPRWNQSKQGSSSSAFLPAAPLTEKPFKRSSGNLAN